MHKATILTIGGRLDLYKEIRNHLAQEGYHILSATGFSDGLMQIELQQNWDLVILDTDLPDGEAVELIPHLHNYNHAPLIVVSKEDDLTEKLVHLEIGADDYLAQPFEIRELAVRIKAHLRREKFVKESLVEENQPDDQIYFQGGWRLDRTQYQLFDSQHRSADLTLTQFQLLEALVLAPKRALDRAYLFHKTHPQYDECYNRAVDIQIGRLRKKLDDNHQNYIKTVRGVGYMFCAEILPVPPRTKPVVIRG